MVKILNTLLVSLKVLLFNGLFAFIIISLLAFFNFSFAATNEKLKADEADQKEKEEEALVSHEQKVAYTEYRQHLHNFRRKQKT